MHKALKKIKYMNFQKFIRVIIYSLLISLFLISCKKNTTTIHYTIPDEMKQWYLYQNGSYWIYQNDKTPQIDCTYISKDPNIWQNPFYLDDGSIGSITDYIGIGYNGNILVDSEITPGEVVISTRDAGSGNIAFLSNILEGEKYDLTGEVYKYIHHFDSLAINNHFIKDVRQTRFAFPMNISGTDSLALTFYFARHIGLIKIIQSKSNIDTTWSLVRYHIVQ